MPPDERSIDQPVIIALFARGVHVEADTLHRMIVAAGAWVRAPGTRRGEDARQLRLRLRQLCWLERFFFEAGFTVVLDDLFLGDRWTQLQDELRNLPLALVVLAPRVDVVVGRDTRRARPTQGEAWARYLGDALRATMAGTGPWIDNSDQTPDETVEAILRQLAPHMSPTPGRRRRRDV